MKNGKVILSAATFVVALASVFAFKPATARKFNQGTLFTKGTTPCHKVNCVRTVATGTSCAQAGPYFTTSSCNTTPVTQVKTSAL